MLSPQQPSSQNTGSDHTTPRETTGTAPKETTSSEEITYSDPFGEILSMYLTRGLKFDDEDVGDWTRKGGADGILVFTVLFSFTVATFITVSYPSLLQDPNVITQSLLLQISQRLSSTNGTICAASLSASTQSSFSPSASVVFVNSVWFLSLALSLTCALIATLLQQRDHRYPRIIQRNHPPHVRAHLQKHFFRGPYKFRVIGLIETLPSLLLISLLLFLAGLVVFAFLANHIVAYITLAIVGICFLSHIALTPIPLIFQDCPYYTPFTSLLWYSAQIIPLSFSLVLHHGAKQLYDRCGTVSESVVKSFRDWHKNKAKSFSEDVISKLKKSAKRIPMVIYKKTLVRTLHWLNEDHGLEEFVIGIPSLDGSGTFAMRGNDGDVQRTILPIPTVLPEPTNSHPPLPWSIIRLAQRAIASNFLKFVQQRRTQTCLRALYYIPGAIRDVLAPKHYRMEVPPFPNSPESQEVIDELWDTPNDDVELSVRCATAVVAAFMTLPRRTLGKFVTRKIRFIWRDHEPSPPPTEGAPSHLQYSVSPISAGPSPANDEPDPSSRAGALV
ncbi:hypothetical protein BJY52DRAFT_1359353 [Lactarius psammicola]|nr:hypothetical protein BJY52DRAFT_1359353 [Lactarius psammicola]